MHASHYDGKTALESFNPVVGLIRTWCGFFDQQVVGTLGLIHVAPPMILSGFLAVGVVILAIFWWKQAPSRYLLLTGLAFIVANNLLVYSARVDWSYERLRTWGRYQVFPHFGLILILVGGLLPWLKRLEQRGGLHKAMPVWVWGCLFLVLSIHAFVDTCIYYNSRQKEQLIQIDEMDKRCRKLGISREMAIKALPPLKMAASEEKNNGWRLLRGSNDPRPLSLEEVKTLLEVNDR